MPFKQLSGKGPSDPYDENNPQPEGLFTYGWEGNDPAPQASGNGRLVDQSWFGHSGNGGGSLGANGSNANYWLSPSKQTGQLVMNNGTPMFQLPEDATFGETKDNYQGWEDALSFVSQAAAMYGVTTGLGSMFGGAGGGFSPDQMSDGTMGESENFATTNNVQNYGSNVPQEVQGWSTENAFADGTMSGEATGGFSSGAGQSNWLKDMMGKGNSFLGDISSSLGMDKNPITMGDLGKAGANFFISNMMADKYANAANANKTAGSALDQPQRQQYQQQFSNLMTNPNDYFQNNPFAKAAIAQMQNSFGPAMAKSGNPFFEADRLGTSFMTQLGSNFNDQANILSNAGGFNGPVGGQGSAQLLGQGLGQQNEAFRTLGSNIFKQQGPMQGQTGQSLINPNTRLV